MSASDLGRSREILIHLASSRVIWIAITIVAVRAIAAAGVSRQRAAGSLKTSPGRHGGLGRERFRRGWAPRSRSGAALSGPGCRRRTWSPDGSRIVRAKGKRDTHGPVAMVEEPPVATRMGKPRKDSVAGLGRSRWCCQSRSRGCDAIAIFSQDVKRPIGGRSGRVLPAPTRFPLIPAPDRSGRLGRHGPARSDPGRKPAPRLPAGAIPGRV